MSNKFWLWFAAFLVVFVIFVSLVTAYSAPDYDNITLVFNAGYSADDYDNITLVFGEGEGEAATISINATFPGENVDVTFHEFFRVDLNVTCLTGTCGVVNVTLDPTIKLQTPDTEILEDAELFKSVSTSEQGEDDNLLLLKVVGGNFNHNTILKANISTVPSGSTVTESLLCLYLESNSLDDDTEGYNVSSHLVYSNFTVNSSRWDEGDSTTWTVADAGEITWNTAPNTSYYDVNTNDNKKFDGDSALGWYCWDITSEIDYAVDNSYSNASIFLTVNTQLGNPSTGDSVAFHSKEHTTASERPYVNITYTLDTSGKSGTITNDTSATPFYHNGTDTYLQTSSLSAGQSETVTFWINATGEIAETKHLFFAFANTTTDESISDQTDDWNVTIIAATPGDTCTYTSGNWDVDCSDNCVISSIVDVGGNNITFTGAGQFWMSANITNYDNLRLSNGCSIVLEDTVSLVSS